LACSPSDWAEREQPEPHDGRVHADSDSSVRQQPDWRPVAEPSCIPSARRRAGNEPPARAVAARNAKDVCAAARAGENARQRLGNACGQQAARLVRNVSAPGARI
ncbi:hypothetical protein IWW41_005996, partial [Coemansia sp. RSA 2522]